MLTPACTCDVSGQLWVLTTICLLDAQRLKMSRFDLRFFLNDGLMKFVDSLPRCLADSPRLLLLLDLSWLFSSIKSSPLHQGTLVSSLIGATQTEAKQVWQPYKHAGGLIDLSASNTIRFLEYLDACSRPLTGSYFGGSTVPNPWIMGLSLRAAPTDWCGKWVDLYLPEWPYQQLNSPLGC